MPIAHNPETGETLRLDDSGQWVNAPTAKNPDSGEMLAFDGKAWVPIKAKAEPSMLESTAGYVNKLGQSVAQGATLGFMDEAAAGLDSPFVAGYRSLVEGQPFDIGKAYDDRLKGYRQDQDEFRRDNPISSVVGEIGGAVAGAVAAPVALAGAAAKTGLPIAAKIANAASAPFRGAPAGTSMIGQMGRGAASGAALGGAYGYGSGEGGVDNRLQGAATGAAIGAATGGVVPLAVEGIRKGGQFIADRTINMMPHRQAGAAERKVAEALMRDGMSPEQAAARIKEMGPEAALMDLGANTRSLARAAHTVPGEGKAKIQNTLIARQEGTRDAQNRLVGGQANRITQNLDEMVPQKGLDTLDALTVQRKRAADPLYKAAYAKEGIHSDRLQQFMDDPVTTAGLKRGLEVQRLEAVASGTPFNPKDAAIVAFNEAGDPVIGGVPNMRTYDAVKRGIDAMIEGEKNAFGKMSSRGRALTQFKNAFVEHLDTLNPEYAAARAAYSGPSQLMDALASGNKFMSKAEFPSPDDMAKAVGKMGADERHYFRIGAVQALRNKVGDSVVRADVTKTLMGNNTLEKQINAAFGDEAMYSKYIDMLKNESQMFDTYAAITKRSATAEGAAEVADAGVDKGRIAEGVLGLVNPTNSGGVLRSIGNIAGGLKDRAAISGPMSRNIGEIMTGQDLARLNKALATAEMSAAQRAAIVRTLSAGGVVGAGRSAPQGQ